MVHEHVSPRVAMEMYGSPFSLGRHAPANRIHSIMMIAYVRVQDYALTCIIYNPCILEHPLVPGLPVPLSFIVQLSRLSAILNNHSIHGLCRTIKTREMALRE